MPGRRIFRRLDQPAAAEYSLSKADRSLEMDDSTVSSTEHDPEETGTTVDPTAVREVDRETEPAAPGERRGRQQEDVHTVQTPSHLIAAAAAASTPPSNTTAASSSLSSSSPTWILPSTRWRADSHATSSGPEMVPIHAPVTPEVVADQPEELLSSSLESESSSIGFHKDTVTEHPSQDDVIERTGMAANHNTTTTTNTTAQHHGHAGGEEAATQNIVAQDPSEPTKTQPSSKECPPPQLIENDRQDWNHKSEYPTTTTMTTTNNDDLDRHQNYSRGGNRADAKKGNTTHSAKGIFRDHHNKEDEEAYSSEEEDADSYFATHLPRPKSSRSYSVSSITSHASAPCARTSSYQLEKYESDASLSFSDESDDEQHPHHASTSGNTVTPTHGTTTKGGMGIPLPPAVLHPHRSATDTNVLPQQHTPMQAGSSLISSNGSVNFVDGKEDAPAAATSLFDDGDDDEMSTSSSPAGGRKRSFTGDDSMTSSLPSVASGSDSMYRSSMDNPTTGGDGNYYYVPAGAMYAVPQHPQQREMPASLGSMLPVGSSQQQHQPMRLMTDNGGPASAFNYHTSAAATGLYSPEELKFHLRQQFGRGVQQLSQHQTEYGRSTGIMESSLNGIISEQTYSTKTSSGSIPFVYSEDEDVVPVKKSDALAMALVKQHATDGSGGAASGSVPAFDNTVRGNGPNNPRENPGSGPADGGFDNKELSTDTAAIGSVSNGKPDYPSTVAKNGGGRQTFKVYWQRWIMLFYMSLLNLLSDWTCYSVAPISLLTDEAFGNIDPEKLVVVFLGANALATACEPIILARLGLRRTVLFGSLLLMIGSILKSGGLPPVIPPSLEYGHSEYNLYLGFFIVGLSQPLYQCTPALLSASWFPEEERTMATGVALNANQLGIGFAFIFGTLLVSKADDIPGYFGLLSQISTLAFIGTLIQFDDAPPTPPSSSAKTVRGSLKPFTMPKFLFNPLTNNSEKVKSKTTEAPTSPGGYMPIGSSHKRSSKSKKSGDFSSGGKREGKSSTRRRTPVPTFQTANTESGLLAPSSAHYGSTENAMRHIENMQADMESFVRNANAPSSAIGTTDTENDDLGSPNQEETNNMNNNATSMGREIPIPHEPQGNFPPGMIPLVAPYGYGYPPPPQQPQYQVPYWDPRMQEQMQQQQYYQQQMDPRMQEQMQQQQYYHQQQMYYQQAHPQFGGGAPTQSPYMPPPTMPYSYQNLPPHLHGFDPQYGPFDYDVQEDGAEPTVTVTNHHLDIDIRDDQVFRSLHACMIRPGFSHALAAFTVSGIVINTLSTYMDYLVRLNGAPRTYTGIVGGAFQFLIMISSLIIGKQTDKSRAYYSVSIGMLVLGAFGLAECGVSLDSDRGGDLRWSLLLVAVLVGPLQPISTELGVEVAYPLSENTVLVIQQLFSNLLSALFIPFFKSLKDVGTKTLGTDGTIVVRPDYTFSFYLLIVIHTLVTVYVATFNGKYLRYEHELQRKAEDEQLEAEIAAAETVANGGPLVHPFYAATAAERQPFNSTQSSY